MQQWRSFFSNCDADIWTVIDMAIILAARDYPKEFGRRRSDIAETLFSRELLELPSGDIDAAGLSGSGITNTTNLEENGIGEEAEDTGEGFSIRADTHAVAHNDGIALNGEENEEASVIRELRRIKELLKDTAQSEKSILELLQRLKNMQVTVEAMKVTEIGRHVNTLRKYPSKLVRSSVKLLVSAWKDLVDEWMKTAGDDATATLPGSDAISLNVKEGQGLVFSPHVEGGSLAVSTTTVKINQSFTDEEMEFPGYRETNYKEGYSEYSLNHSIADHMHISKPQLSGTQTFLGKSRFVSTTEEKNGTQKILNKSDFVLPPCFNEKDRRVIEERGSSSGADLDFMDRIERRPESDSRHSTSYNGSTTFGAGCNGRISTTAAFNSLGPGKITNEATKSKINGSSDSGSNCNKNWNPPSANKILSEDMQTAQKLEISKRKLHEGYQQAENAKKQPTAVRFDPVHLPKEGVNQGKIKSNGQSKPISQSWYQNQNRK